MKHKNSGDEVASFYGDVFADWDPYYNPNKQIFDELNLHPDYFNNKKVLDAGCGMGRIFFQILRHCNTAELVGIDLGDKQIAYVRKYVNQYLTLNKGDKVVKVEKKSVLSTGYPDKYFDIIICYGVLHHTGHTIHGVQELYRILKDDGKLYIWLYGKNLIETLFREPLRYVLPRMLSLEKALGYLTKLMNSDFIKKRRSKGYDPTGPICKLLDPIYAPIRDTYSRKQLIDELESIGLEVNQFYDTEDPNSKDITIRRIISYLFDSFTGVRSAHLFTVRNKQSSKKKSKRSNRCRHFVSFSSIIP